MTVTFLSDPEFSDNNSPADIVSRMINAIPSRYDTAEGSIVYDLLSAFADELSSAYAALDTVALQVYPQTAAGDYLDAISESFGVIRRPATKSVGSVTFIGATGTVVPVGTRVSTLLTAPDVGEPIFFETTEEITLTNVVDALNDYSDGSAAVICTDFGISGNVSADSIARIEDNVSGLISVTNDEATAGGRDEQTDDELRESLLDRVRNGRGAGTAGDYEAAALTVNGIAEVVVEPLWNGNGTVRVIVMDEQSSPVLSTLVPLAQAAVDLVTPLGAEVTVVTPASASLDFVVDVTLEDGLTINEVSASVETAIANYLKTVDPGGVVYLTEVSAAIVQAPGVIDLDFTSLTIETVNANYQLADNTKGIFSTLTLGEA